MGETHLHQLARDVTVVSAGHCQALTESEVVRGDSWPSLKGQIGINQVNVSVCG